MQTHKFRPIGLSAKDKIFYNRRFFGAGKTNFHARVDFTTLELPKNRQVISRIYSKLHNLSRHSPEPIRKKWSSTERQFLKRYCGDPLAQSSRFADKYTAWHWL